MASEEAEKATPTPTPTTEPAKPNEAKRAELRAERAERVEERRERFEKMFTEMDVNHDGFISREEFNAMPRVQNLDDEKRTQLFNRLDKDDDGKLSREEMQRRPHRRGGPGGPGGMQRLMELDTDKSGGVSFEEFRQGEIYKKMPEDRLKAMFERLDSDGDGEITPKDHPHRGPRADRGNREHRGPRGGEKRPNDGDKEESAPPVEEP